MPHMNKKDQEFLAYLLKVAAGKAMDAGFSGSMSDGGATVLREQISCWVAGYAADIPDCWIPYWKKFMNESDPEYAEYERLKKKFGG